MDLIMPYFLTNKAWYTVSEDENETLENFVFDDERDKDKRIFQLTDELLKKRIKAMKSLVLVMFEKYCLIADAFYALVLYFGHMKWVRRED